MTILDIKEIFNREFNKYRKTLKEISKESKNGPSVINDQEKLYYHFDKIKETTVYKNASEMPASPDTLIFKDDEIVLVEFKNGRIENIKKKKKEIKLKALEGGLLS
jgi:effector-binding domain-containing protein